MVRFPDLKGWTLSREAVRRNKQNNQLELFIGAVITCVCVCDTASCLEAGLAQSVEQSLNLQREASEVFCGCHQENYRIAVLFGPRWAGVRWTQTAAIHGLQIAEPAAQFQIRRLLPL